MTSAVSVPAVAGIPVTHRSLAQGFCVVSGHVAPSDPRSTVDWAALAASGLTLVILMGVKQLGVIAESLVEGGMRPSTPAAVVEDGTTPGQRVIRGTLADVADRTAASDVRPPAIVVVGDVAGLDLSVGAHPH